MTSAEPVPDGPATRTWQKAVSGRGTHVTRLRRREELYNSAVVADPERADRYRKTYLWSDEKLVYGVGRDLPVFDTPLGRTALLVCCDARFAEAARTLAVGGAGIICVPAPTTGCRRTGAGQALTMLNLYANANRLFVARADRVGNG